MEDGPLPDLRDIELKLGRKVPESLLRSLRGEEPVPPERDRDPGGGSGGGGSGCSSSSSCCSFPLSLSSSSSSSPTSGSPQPSHSSSTLERLETKLHLLRQEMVSVVRPAVGGGTQAARTGRWGRGDRATGAAEPRAGFMGNTGERGAQRVRIWMWLQEACLRATWLGRCPPCSSYFLKPTRCYRL